MKGRMWIAVVLLLLVAAMSSASADELPPAADGGVCKLHDTLPTERLLRRLSLDLRGYVPTYDELVAVDGLSEVPEATIDAFLASDGYRVEMRRYHEQLLWPNPSVQLWWYYLWPFDAQSSPDVFDVNLNAGRLRGDNLLHCQNVEQTTLQTGYQLGDAPYCEPKAGGTCQEGWVEVHPYWEPDPATTIKVCAFAAQTLEYFNCTSLNLADGACVNEPGKPVFKFRCGTRAGIIHPNCGCGPDLRWCQNHVKWHTPLVDAMREQMLRMVDDHTDGSRPYSEILTSKRAWYNGMLMHWRKHLAPAMNMSRPLNDYAPEDGAFPDPIVWGEDNWVEVERSGAHAGILTLPVYSLRFQTNRGRANRFRIAFTGQYFQPPDVDDYEDCDPYTNDLTNRCVCRKCHQTLEPLAAHFGQISETGSTMMTSWFSEYKTEILCDEQVDFNDVRVGNYCKYLYTQTNKIDVDADLIVWRINALQWADNAHPDIQTNFDAGPAAMAQQAIDQGLVARATVTNLFRYLYHREMILDPSVANSEVTLLDELATEFQSQDDFKALVKRLVSRPEYRRTP